MLAIPVSWVRESTRSGAIRVVELGRYRRIARRLCWLAGACSKAGRPLTLGGLECAEHLDRSAFRGVDELVFCHPDKGSPLPIDGYVTALKAALAAAESTDPVRLFRDLRHRSPTNGAAAGETPIVLMSRAGHANMSTTQSYLHLAGVVTTTRRRRSRSVLVPELVTDLR